MLIDLSALLRGEVTDIALDFDITPNEAPYGIEFTEGAHLTGRIEDTGGYIRLTAVAKVPYRGECARCLDPVTGVLEVNFERTLVPEGVMSEERLEEEADEYLAIRRGMLDIDEALCESVFLEFPQRLLCSPDCGGLCSVCGRKLAPNEKCDCSPKEIDPRWAKLRELLRDDESTDEE